MPKGTTMKLKASELIFDWNLWPRHEVGDLDSTHLRRMKEALLLGVKMPPVIVNRTDHRIIDGFHRTRAIMDVFGDDADVDVELRTYKSEAEMFTASVAYNSKHGLPLNSKDRAHVIIKAMKLQIPTAEIAKVLGMSEKAAEAFSAGRTAKREDGSLIALPYGASALAGKTLTEEQEHFARTSNGTVPIVHARILLNALTAEAVQLDETAIDTLKQLHLKLGEVLA